MIPSRGAIGELDLRDYLSVLRRRKGTVVLAVVSVVASALAFSFLQTPVYAADSEILLRSRASERIFQPSAAQPVSQTPVQTEIEVMQSRSVRAAVAEALGAPAAVSITARGATEVIVITAESTEPAEAARVANTYAETYIASRRQQLIDDLLAGAEQVRVKVGELDGQLVALEPPGDASEAERERFLTENAGIRQTLRDQRATLTAQLDQLDLAQNLTETGGAQLVSEAVAPIEPVRPTPLRNGILALAVGALLGVALAFLFEYLDDRVKTKDHLQAATGSLTVLGLIPAVSSWKDRRTTKVVALTEPSSPAAEAYRTLRTSVQFIGLERPTGILQLTSPSAAEGKTTTLANLAVALARAGQRVVIVDCDLRRPRIHEFFGLDNALGFTSVLLGQTPLAQAMQVVPGEPRLALLASGPPPPNPSELLSSRRAVEMLTALKADSDVVLVDSPPVLPVTDAIVLAGSVDATVLVATANRSTRRDTHRAVELLQQVDTPLVGTVLNGVDPEATYGYGYGYGYGYSYGYGYGSGKVAKKDLAKKDLAKKDPVGKKDQQDTPARGIAALARINGRSGGDGTGANGGDGSRAQTEPPAPRAQRLGRKRS